ncbi:MAG: helix-turn-helix transcriptional regulator [Dehalococcoidia bacterium]|nr:helix-turn-helix transcriptional regulator [Dehalococcoidia bacterium]
MSALSDRLRELRHSRRLTQAELARRSGISVDSIESYETARRHPPRETLIDLCDALRLDPGVRNDLLTIAGHEPELAGPIVQIRQRRLAWETIQREAQEYTWPCLAMTEHFEIMGWNSAANDVAELDLGRDLAKPGARQLMRMAASDWFYPRLSNWDTVISVMIGMWKYQAFDVNDPANATTYFNNLVQDLVNDSPAVFPRFVGLWTTAEPAGNIRHSFPVEWRLGDGRMLRFDATMGPWSQFDFVAALDWFPADAATWRYLDERRKARGNVPAEGQPQEPMLAGMKWNDLLRLGRERFGFTRRELASLTGISDDTLYSYESGRRRPSRETLVALFNTMQLETLAANQILHENGYDLEPSDWSRFLIGDTPRANKLHNTTRELVGWEGIQRYIAAHRWPCFIVDGRCEVKCANDPAIRLTGIDFAAMAPEAPNRNLLHLVTDPAFRQYVPGWREVAAHILPGSLAPYVSGDARDAESSYFLDVVNTIRRRDPDVIHELISLWQGAERPALRARHVFPLSWRISDGTLLDFHVIISQWNDIDPAWAMDWHPANAETWERMSVLTSNR